MAFIYNRNAPNSSGFNALSPQSMFVEPQTVFFFGATGYLGSQFLILLNEKLPQLHVVALLRNATRERKGQLQKVYPNISFVEGSLDDDAIIREQVSKVDIVINCASSDHPASVKCMFIASARSGSGKLTSPQPSDPCRARDELEKQPRKASPLYPHFWLWYRQR